MKFLSKLMSMSMLTLALPIIPTAHAHLMVAQHGTLNIIDDGVYLVLSLPMSGFEGVDDDLDGGVSMVEFNKHRTGIMQSIAKNVTLTNDDSALPLQGVMLSPEMEHDSPDGSLQQLIVLGRFALQGDESDLHFHVGVYGKRAAEQTIKITATNSIEEKESVFVLSVVKPSRSLFQDLET